MLNLTSESTRDMEASALSALLVPGGQIPISIPTNNLRPLGRSTITKVSSPYFNSSEVIKSEKTNLTSESLSSIGDSDSKAILDEDKFIDDNAFNWYFQQYNDTHLDPFLGVVYGGVGRLLINQWTFLGTQMIIVLKAAF